MKILNRTRTRTKDCVSVLLPFHLCLQVFFSIWTSVVFTHWGCDAAVVLWTGHRHYTTDTNRSPSLFIFRLSIHEKKNTIPYTHSPHDSVNLSHSPGAAEATAECVSVLFWVSDTSVSPFICWTCIWEFQGKHLSVSCQTQLSVESFHVHLKVTSVFFLKKFWRKLQWILQAEMYIYIFAFC